MSNVLARQANDFASELRSKVDQFIAVPSYENLWSVVSTMMPITKKYISAYTVPSDLPPYTDFRGTEAFTDRGKS